MQIPSCSKEHPKEQHPKEGTKAKKKWKESNHKEDVRITMISKNKNTNITKNIQTAMKDKEEE